jgi:hypothetical protein
MAYVGILLNKCLNNNQQIVHYSYETESLKLKAFETDNMSSLILKPSLLYVSLIHVNS